MRETAPSGAAGTAPSRTGRSGSRRTGAAFALLVSVQLTLIAAITVIGIATPAIQRDLAFASTDLALLNASYGLTFASLLLLGGRLADLHGRRRMLTIGLTVVAAASAAAAVAPNFTLLVAARFAQGAGAAAAAPAAMAMLGVVYPDPAARARATAVWGGLGSIGATAGTLLAGAVVTWASWRWVFAITFGVTAVIAAAAPRLLPAGPPPAPARLDLPGAALSIAGLVTLSNALLTAADHPWGSPRVLLPLLAGALLLGGMLVVEARTGQPLLPPAFLTAPGRGPALLAVLLTAAGMATSFLLLSLYLQQLRGWSPLATSGAFLAPGLALVAVGRVTGPLVGRLGTRTVTAAGLLTAAGGLGALSIPMATTTSGSLPLVAGLTVLTLGAGLAFAGAAVTAVYEAPDHQAGLAGGLFNTAVEIGPPVGIALLTSLAAAHTSTLASIAPAAAAAGGYAHALRIAAAGFALAALATIALGARRRAAPAPAPRHPAAAAQPPADPPPADPPPADPPPADPPPADPPPADPPEESR